jgi:NADH-quinone oxidoreductase subunit N
MAALSAAGIAAILYYLAGYLFTVVAAFTVIALVVRQGDDEDVSVLAGLNQRSPFLALTMTVAMVSLAGVPPLAGFFGKFLLLKAIIERGGSSNPAYYWLAAAALVGIVISLWYYFGVIRAIFWSQEAPHKTAIETSWVIRASLGFCLAGMLFLGLYPDPVLQWAIQAANILNWGLPSP